MSDTQTLSKTVERIESKAAQKDEADNVEDRVERAQTTVARINTELRDLAEAIEHLQFYRQILLEAFDGTEPPIVRRALDDAEAVITKDRREMVSVLRDGNPEEFRKQVSEATEKVKDARQSVYQRLKDDHWSEWNEKIASARELQRILGSSDTKFDKTIKWTHSIVTQKMQNPDKSAAGIVQEWENAKTQWENHQDMQGISQFQQSHGISDEAVDEIRTLSQGSTTLAEVDLEILRELKDIPELAKSISLEI
ncbi:hypothetical protein [Haloarchaeobius amylolyticus]|uniref:hypothetical protein n=1 Tax=Haloarchaeobius amylolyticus TaxID=1198296 RepID=UPI00226DC6CF|nr:hypothetical protein [Haloarchaeobius amylolyticus]